MPDILPRPILQAVGPHCRRRRVGVGGRGKWRGRAPLRGIAGGGRAGACRRRRTLIPCLLAALLPALSALCSPPFIDHPGHLQDRKSVV